MALVLSLLVLLAPQPPAEQVPKVVELLKKKDVVGAVHLLQEIAKLKGNHAEAKALVKMIRSARPQKPPEVIEAAFLALKGIGSKKVTRNLVALLDHSRLRKNDEVRIGICRALEGSADPAGVDALVKLIRDDEDRVIAAAGQAAGAYRYAKEPVRKELFSEILKRYIPTWNLMNSVKPELKKDKARAEKRWPVISKPMEKSLELLSNVTQPHPGAWRHWWNKNKRKRWSAAEAPS